MDPTLSLLVEYRISMAFLLAFMLLFLRLRYNVGQSIAIAVGCFLVTWLMDTGIYTQASSVGVRVLCTIGEAAIVQGCAFLLSRYRDSRALFTGITAAAYVLFGNVLFSTVDLYSGNAWIAIAAQTAMHTGLLAVFYIRLRPFYREEMDYRTKGWAVLCVLPLLFYCTIYSLYVLPGQQQTPATVLTAVFVLLLMVAAYDLMFKLVAWQRREDTLQRNNEYLETYARNLEQSAHNLQEAESETALIRHDIRHYAALIKAYLDADEPAKIHELLVRLNERLDDVQSETYCENIAVNGILSSFAHIARAEHIPFFCEATVPQVLEGIDEFEFATVVSNLLENAFIATEEISDPQKRFVRLKARRVKNQRVLEVSNSFSGERRLDRETGLPLTRGGAGHGYGLRSVQAFTAKSGGMFDYSIEDDVFYVRVAFPGPVGL